MRFWPFGRRTNRKLHDLQRRRLSVVPFPGDTHELPKAKYHCLRALCGLLTNTDSSCSRFHPFCGSPPVGSLENAIIRAIVHCTSQQDADTGAPVIALYICVAVDAPKYVDSESGIGPLEYAATMIPRDTVPNSKLVVSLLENGNYWGEYGLIVSPVEGDYSTGCIDRGGRGSHPMALS